MTVRPLLGRRPLLDRLADRHDPLTALLFDAMPTAMALIGRDGARLRCNAAWRALATADLADMFAPDAAGLVASALTDSLSGQTATPLPDLRLAEGGITIGLQILPLANGDGALLVAEDRSPTLLLQAQLAQSQRLQAVGALAGGIGHDFNNLLAAVLGAADAIAERKLEPDTRHDLGIIQASAERGAALVRQLLAFGGQQTLQPLALAVNPALDAVFVLLQRLLPASVDFRLELENPGRHVLIDPGQFDQIVMNLAVNARDAMPEGGTLRLASGHATLLHPLPSLPDTVPPGRYVTIEVRDSGSGIAPDLLGRIFEPFFTTRRAAGGTGLGLATVLGIVHQSNGFMTLASTPGQGTWFRLYFPRYAAPLPVAAPVAAPAAAPVAAKPNGGMVLLVDDEEPLRQLAARLLTRRGWTVLSAEDAATALALLDQAPPIDAVVTDLVMPGMDGSALVQEVRRRLGRPDLPAILVSGYAQAGLRDRIGGVATIFMPKPYRLAELADRLATLAQR